MEFGCDIRQQRKAARGVGRTSLSATKCDGNVTSTHCCAIRGSFTKVKKFSKEKRVLRSRR
jgi:hypothetical protein